MDVFLGNNQACPSRSYPGIWEMVINQLEINGHTCGMVDSCPTNLSEDEVYKLLTHNFKRHYLTNRAPYGLYFHSAWFKKAENLAAFQVYKQTFSIISLIYQLIFDLITSCEFFRNSWMRYCN